MLHLHTFHSCEKPALHPATHGQDYSGYSIPEEGQWIYIHLWLYMTLMCDVNYHVQNSVSGNMIIYMFTLYLWYNMMKQLHWQLVLDIDELCCQVWHKFTYLTEFFMNWFVNWLEYDLSIQEYLFFIYKQASVLVNLLNSSTCLARIKLIVCMLNYYAKCYTHWALYNTPS